MYKAKAVFFAILSIIVSSVTSGRLDAQCFGSLALSPDFFGYDYLARICVHFGDISTIPYDIVCETTMPPGDRPVEFPIYA